MKELKEKLIDPLEVRQEREIKKGFHKIGVLRPYPGQHIWKLDLEKQEITKAPMEEYVEIVDGKPVTKKKLKLEPQCLYNASASIKAARKKFFQQIRGLTGNISTYKAK